MSGANGMTVYHYYLGYPQGSGFSGPAAFEPSTYTVSAPPFLVAAGTVPVLGPGVIASKVATASDPGGSGTIVTYDGAPLYYCTYDKAPGDYNCDAHVSGKNFLTVQP